MLKRAGSKAIAVEGRRYRYVVSEEGGDGRSQVRLVVIVQDDEENAAHLRVTGLTVRRLPEMQSKRYRGREVDPCVEPRHVDGLIRRAMASGWKPMSSGRAFVLRVGNEDVFESEPTQSRPMPGDVNPRPSASEF